MLIMPKPVKGTAEADEEFDALYEAVVTKGQDGATSFLI